ncbi:MAG: SDR family oxidoreductase [Acidimicrobiales bacterium]|nr:SDR family oxidoreductase [Acidimicrobiales bacterium]
MPVAVVTGANSGIGLATTLRLARDGHTVYAAMRDLDKAGDLRNACFAEGFENVNLLRIEVTDDHSVDLAFEQVRTQSGPVDILVNNAGISAGGAIEDTDIETFERVMDTNYLGPIRCIRAVLPDMRARASGTIVNVSSIGGRVFNPTMAAYNASKAALEAVSEVLAQEVAIYGIRVVVIEPGVVATPIFAKAEPHPPDTAYPMHYERNIARFAKLLQSATSPDAVAAVIAEALTTATPKFRWLVGPDAERAASARDRLSDEDYIGLSALDTTAWKRAWSDAFGTQLD